MFRGVTGRGQVARGMRVLPLILAGALLLVGYQARMRLVDQALPYCQHIDEHTWTSIAIRMIKTGDLNPHRFTKPSVMVYLDTAAFSLGMLKAGMSGQPVPSAESLREGGYPYYSSTVMIRTARQVYAALSIVAIALAALIARRIALRLQQHPNSPVSHVPESGLFSWISFPDFVGLLTIVITLLSTTYLRYSHWYLGVDLLGCAFAMATLAYVVLRPRNTRPAIFGVVAGLLSGLCLGTKYNLYPIAVPVLLAIFTSYKKARLSTTVLFFASLIVTFLITTPYALLDLPAFIWSAAGEAHHYATGHGSHSRPAGVPMFAAYGETIPDNFGWILVVAAISGAVVAGRSVPLTTAVVAAYPLCLWLYMSGQRAFFARNLLILQLIVPIFASIGLLVFWRVVCDWVGSRPWLVSLPHTRRLANGLMTLCLVASIPWSAIAKSYAGPVESRNEAVSWVQKRGESTVLVAKELEMDVRPLRSAKKKVVVFSAVDARFEALVREYPGALVLAPSPRADRAGLRIPKGQRLKQWGTNLVGVNAHRATRIRLGNPRLVVARLELAKKNAQDRAK